MNSRLVASDINIQKAHLEVRGNLRKFFSNTKDVEVILDGPAGTGKTRVGLERQHLILSKYPGARGLLVRKFRSSMTNTCLQILRDEVYKDSRGNKYADAPEWHERDQEFVYSNNAKWVIAGMDDPTKIMSSQFDFFYANEAIELKRFEWEQMMSRLRNFKVPYQQAIGDTNPGPVSHWIHKYDLLKKIKVYSTSHKDNPVYWDAVNQKWTVKGDLYVNKILGEGLSGLSRFRLYDGLWRSAEGQVYDTWDPDIHVIGRFRPPSNWWRYWSFDFGYVDPFVWQEWVENPNTGQLILYRELYHTKLTVRQAVELIKNAVKGDPGPVALVCDHDAENRAQLETEFQNFTLAAFKSIHPGINAVKNRLTPSKRWSTDDQPRPGLCLMEEANIKTDPELQYRKRPTCTQDEWEGYVWDTTKMDQDKYKDLPIDRDNHGLDPARYIVAFVDNIAIDPQEQTHVIQYNDLLELEELQGHYRDTMISEF